MFLNSALQQLASLIAEKTNNMFVTDEEFKIALKNFLNDLFLFHDDPNDPESQQKNFKMYIDQLTVLPTTQLAVSDKSIAILCVYAAQIAAMRGLLKNKDAFKDRLYLAMFHRHFVTPQTYWIKSEERGNWSDNMRNIIATLNDPNLIAFHYAAANYDSISFDKELDKHLNERNAYGETVVELAVRCEKPAIVNTFLRTLNPSIAALFAARMVSWIEASGFFSIPAPQELTAFIQSLLNNNLLAIGAATSADYIPTPQIIPGITNLKRDHLIQTPSEIEYVFEILVTILAYMKDEKARTTFLKDQQFYRTKTDLTPAILCTLSFQIASLIGHHIHEWRDDLQTYARLHREAYYDNLANKALAKWQSRTLRLLGLFTPISSASDETFDYQFYQEIDVTKLNEWDALQDFFCELNTPAPHPRPTATSSPYTPTIDSQRERSTSTTRDDRKKCNIL